MDKIDVTCGPRLLSGGRLFADDWGGSFQDVRMSLIDLDRADTTAVRIEANIS